jgi:cysteine desulfurase/selenocysteine lyase
LEKLGLPAQAGMESVREHDMEIVGYALDKLNKVTNLVILGPQDPEIRSGSVSFTYNGVHAHDVATILSESNVMVRSGHHCTMILHEKMGVAASVRASFNVYTTKSDIDSLVEALGQVKKTFGK